MDLKSVLTGKSTLEFYWALVIEPGWVQAGIWNIQEGKANVVSIGPSAAWETDDELTNASDTALSAAIQNLPEDAGEPTKTVFGVSSSWVTEGQINAEFLVKIKKICSALSLTPVGFVVINEAIAYYIKSDEGAPLNAIVIGVGNENIEISVFKLGSFSGTQIVSRSVSVANDVAEGLSRFVSQDNLPSRILVYDGKEGQLDEVRQALMNASWEDYEKIKFLHTPKIEVLIPDKKVLAVALAGGAEIASVTKVEKPLETSIAKEEPSVEKSTVGEGPARNASSIAEAGGEELASVEEPQLADLGFVMGKDISQKESLEPQEKVLPEEEKQPELTGQVKQKVPIPSVEYQPQITGVLPIAKSKLSGFLRNVFTKINAFLEKFGTSKGYTVEGAGKKFFGKRVLFLGVAVFLIIFIGGFAFWWYVPKATVTIYVSPQKLEQSETVFVDPKADEVDFEKQILPGEFTSQKESGDKTKSTSGTKTVGEKAKGEVTLYRSGSGITLDAGTKLGGPGGLEFTLDGDTTIASGSASSPGTTKANVTATDIGAQYNLAAGSTFSVSNYPKSELEAKNDSAFSGGTSREINAVSESDQDSLEKDLKNELLDKAVTEIQNSQPPEKIFIAETATADILDETFSNKVGDEASTLKLSLSIEVKGLVIDKANLLDFANEVLKDKVANGYVLRNDQIDIGFEFLDEDKGIFEIKTNFKANLLPEINSDKIKKDIAGKYPTLANEYLSSIQGFSRVGFTIKPKFPGRLGTLPRQSKNITIEISSD